MTAPAPTAELLNELQMLLDWRGPDGLGHNRIVIAREKAESLAVALHQAAAVAQVEVQSASVRQYYYRANECKAPHAYEPGCICWHDEGTGPLADDASNAKDWRIKAQSAPVAQAAPMRDVLSDLEEACQRLAAKRPQAAYDAMIDGGQQNDLLALDQARAAARAALAGSPAQAAADPAAILAGAQALANDVWHPPQPLRSLALYEQTKFKRQAQLVLEAASSMPSAHRGTLEDAARRLADELLAQHISRDKFSIGVGSGELHAYIQLARVNCRADVIHAYPVDTHTYLC